MIFPKNTNKPLEYADAPRSMTNSFVKNGFILYHPYPHVKKNMFMGIDIVPRELEAIASMSDPKDVFRTKLGDIKQIQNLNKLPALKPACQHINAFLAELIGLKEDEYEVLNNQYFCKPPNYKMTSAHQDNAYFETTDNVVTFWIPLQDVDMINSCMFYVPESHQYGLVEHKIIGTNVRTRTGKTGYSLYSDVYPNHHFVKIRMGAFDILVHDKNTMHFSSANQSGDYRIAFTCIMRILGKPNFDY